MPKFNRSWLEFSMRPAFSGTILFLLALFTWFILLTNSSGLITNAWIDSLEALFGIGVWLFPLFIGAIGLWMVIHALDYMQDMAWQRPLGCTLLFLAFIIGASLWYPPSTWITTPSVTGGSLGIFLAAMLEKAIGLWGAWACVTILTLAALILILENYVLKWIASMPNYDPAMLSNPARLLQHILTGLWSQIAQLWGVGRKASAGIRSTIKNTAANSRQFQRQKGTSSKPSTSTHNPSPIKNPEKSQKHPMTQSTPQHAHQSQPRTEKNTPAQNVPAKHLPAKHLPAQNASAQNASAQNASAQNVSAQNASAQNILAQNVLAQNVSAKKVPHIVGSITEWHLPVPDDVLVSSERAVENDEHIREQGKLIQETLALFGVPVSFEAVSIGPTVTQYLIKPGYVERTFQGEKKRVKVKVSKIAVLANDLALALAAASVRIEAPIPGTRYVGVEVPNQSGNMVGLKDLMDGEAFQERRKSGKLPIALGEDVKGNPIVADLAKMPHLLIAGATGSGKSACINAIITCLLCTHTPDTLRMLMVDPKMVELNIYNSIPHLLSPVVTEVEKAAGVLYWAVKEMERRYSLLSSAGARDLERYNTHLTKRGEKPLPFIVVIVDEMADLMMVAPEDVEKHICRLAQMARAVGIHMIIATQRPSVDVITGLIKANFPARISFAVTSQTDSRVIMDRPGAEALLGKGDMLFMSPDASKLERLQGTYVNDQEISNIAHYWEMENQRMTQHIKQARALEMGQAALPAKSTPEIVQQHKHVPQLQQPAQIQQTKPHSTRREEPSPSHRATRQGNKAAMPRSAKPSRAKSVEPSSEKTPLTRAIKGRDDLFEAAAQVVQEARRGSVSLLQRKLRVGINRANRLVDQLEQAGILGPDVGEHVGRQVLISSPVTSPPIIGNRDSRSVTPQVWM